MSGGVSGGVSGGLGGGGRFLGRADETPAQRQTRSGGLHGHGGGATGGSIKQRVSE